MAGEAQPERAAAKPESGIGYLPFVDVEGNHARNEFFGAGSPEIVAAGILRTTMAAPTWQQYVPLVVITFEGALPSDITVANPSIPADAPDGKPGIATMWNPAPAPERQEPEKPSRTRESELPGNGHRLPGKGLSSDASPAEAEAFFRRIREERISRAPVNLGELCDNKEVCALGESHDDLSAKELIAQQVANLARSGYTQIGFEMIDYRDTVLADYLAGRVFRDELLKRSPYGRHRFASFQYDPRGPSIT